MIFLSVIIYIYEIFAWYDGNEYIYVYMCT